MKVQGLGVKDCGFWRSWYAIIVLQGCRNVGMKLMFVIAKDISDFNVQD